MIILLNPCLTDLVEKLQAQRFTAPQESHQPAFKLGPEHFLLTILIRRIWQGGLMTDPEPDQPASGFFGKHRRTVVGHQCPWQATLEQGLAQGMDQVW